MKRSNCWLLLLVVLFSLACENGGPGLPTDPTPPPVAPPPPPPPSNAISHIWGYVLDETWNCVTGAVVEIVDGPGTGRTFRQTECDFDVGIGYAFGDLPYGSTVRLRATKEGYLPAEVDAVPVHAARATIIHLKRQ